MKLIFDKFAKNSKGRHFMINGHKSFRTFRKSYILWQLLEAGTLLLNFVHYYYSHQHLIRATYLRISKTIANSAPRYLKEGSLLQFKFSGLRIFYPYSYLIKNSVFQLFCLSKKSVIKKRKDRFFLLGSRKNVTFQPIFRGQNAVSKNYSLINFVGMIRI